jgi:hypothetical protein
VTVAIEIFLIVLLLLAMGYGFILNRRIVALRRDQKDLEKLAVTFNKATQRAESGVAQLRVATQGSVTQLHEAIGRAEAIRRDLEFLIDRGQGTADKLERGVRTAERGGPRPTANEDTLLGKRRAVDPAEKADAERQLLKALRAVR